MSSPVSTTQTGQMNRNQDGTNSSSIKTSINGTSRPTIRLLGSSSTWSLVASKDETNDTTGTTTTTTTTKENTSNKPSCSLKPKIRLLASSSSLSDETADANLTGSSDDDGIEMDYGVVVSINNEGKCEVSFRADANYRMIHPNTYAPDALQNVQRLGGGGSGVAVFSGHSPILGPLVMKHGGYKDMAELFALATIAQELKRRAGGGGGLSQTVQEGPKPDGTTSKAMAALDMQQRIPEFRMIYMSPHHFRSRGAEFWGSLKQLIKSWSLFSLPGVGGDSTQNNSNGNLSEASKVTDEATAPTPKVSNSSSTLGAANYKSSPSFGEQVETEPTSNDDMLSSLPSLGGGTMQSSFSSSSNLPPMSPRVPGTSIRPSVIIRQVNPHGLNFGRSIRLYEGADDQFSFQLDGNCESVALVFARNSCDFLQGGRTVQLRGNGYVALKTMVDELTPLMTDRLFKFTLGQKTIGGQSPTTGNQLLYAGKLHGELLESLVTQMIHVIRDLQVLTLPEEVDVVDTVRAEVAKMNDTDHNDQDDFQASDLSKLSDTFVGNAIKKNFHPTKGRSRLMEQLGKVFRERPVSLILTPEEELPAFHLGELMRPGAVMGDTFVNVPNEPTLLQRDDNIWKNLLRFAVEDRPGRSAASLQRVWTCGLADAGLHNLFLSKDNVWLFDLGEPQLQSLPGFLTKFLFSFFHTLGMQEKEDKLDPNNPNKDWVRRFITQGENKLALTEETIQLLPKAYDAFEVCLNRIIEHVFDGDNSLRWLLIRYVTLQLLSDSGFCLQRWQVKGGGRERKLNHNKGIEKWLWRALWDFYVAYDINTQASWKRFQVVPPHQE